MNLSKFKETLKRKSSIEQNARYYILIGAIVILFAIFSIVSKGFFSFNTFINIFFQSAALFITAIGMTFIIITGGIDLSVGSTIALSGAMAAIVMQSMGNEGPVIGIIGVLVSIIVAVAVGFVNGVIIGYLKASAFIITLAMMNIARGLTLTITDSSRILVDNNFFNSFASYKVFNRIYLILFIIIILYIFVEKILNSTTFGRKTYAIGDNPMAAKASGINVEFNTCMAYVYAGLFIGLAAVVTAGRTRSAQPLAGIGMEFDVITAVVLGGTSLFGGIGNLKGTALGATLMAVISTGLGMLDISPFYTHVVKGVLILLAVLGNRYLSDSGKGVFYRRETGTHIDSKNLNRVLELIKSDKQKILSLKNIYKTFPGVKALDNISFDIKKGQVHALCGENGAGKSTLIKVLSGVYSKDSGEIEINGIPVSIKSPIDSQRLGISVIYQELAMVPELNVYQNFYLGNEIVKKSRILLNIKKMIENTKKLLSRFNLKINVRSNINDFTVGQQQMVAVTKSLGSKSWIIVMDEPTSAITEAEKEKLFEMIREIKSMGIAIVYISHRISEIFEIADEVTILRDGKHIITAPVKELDENKTIKYMVGRELDDIFYREKRKTGKVLMEVKDLYKEGVFNPISFKVYEGEVLGFSGLLGAGRTEIMRCIFGLDKPDGGEIYIDSNKVNIKSPVDAIRAGISYISEDRRREGIIPNMSVNSNISLASLPWLNKLGWIDKKQENKLSEEYVSSLSIKTPSIEHLVMSLSGGNQQKVCVAKWLARNPKVIIMDEPTRGIDVGAKSEIHKLIDNLAKQNMSIILISSEMPEIIGASNRIIAMYEGEKIKEFNSKEPLDQEILMRSISGIKD